MTEASTKRPAPIDDKRQPPLDRYCDLVLTGGVADGVVYPWAIIEIARAYQFKNIAGTSVGAMAAALTAAAEYSRRRGSLAGFNDVLLQVPTNLAEKVGGQTRLMSLFRPAQETTRLFELFVGIVGAPTNADPGVEPAIRRGLRALLSSYRWPALSAALGALAIGAVFGLGWWHLLRNSTLTPAMRWGVGITDLSFTLLLFALLLPLGIGFALYRDLVYGLVKNRFGICTGRAVDGSGEQALIEWLHEGIQAASGRRLDEPLTFGDLWNAPGGPLERPLAPAPRTERPRSIDLRMVTTSLTHTRPYDLPNLDPTSRLFFKLDELSAYFPAAVIAHLDKYAVKYNPAGPDDPEVVPECFRELPAADLPIVVAARLSLSFPVLFSAVPLWAIDYEQPPEARGLSRCWFSDGGICSNFPIHLFDAAVPEWPTFGIWLGNPGLDKRSQVWLPQFHYEGRHDSWLRFGERGDKPSDSLAGFIESIVDSAKDWNDHTTMRMPGVRDRVVRVYVDSNGSSGLNLKLSADQILKYAEEYGTPAGQALVQKFIAGPGWREHRWVRFNTFLSGLRERTDGSTAAAARAPHSETLSSQILAASNQPPLLGCSSEGSRTLTSTQSGSLEALLSTLSRLEQGFAQSSVPQPFKPLPRPSLRVRPSL